MKRIKTILAAAALLIMTLMCIPVHGDTISTEHTSEKSGLVKEDSKYCYYKKGKKLKNTWKTVEGNRYYFNESGYAATYSTQIGSYRYIFRGDGTLVRPSKVSFQKVGKYTYYVDTKGRCKTGWFMVGKRLYRADYKGRISKSKTYEGITLTKNGYAKTNTASKLKIKAMNIVSSITNSGMSKEQKLRACWNYITNRGRFQYFIYDFPVNKDWHRVNAWYLLNYGRGDCYGFACAFAALAREAGYDSYVIMGRVSGTRDGAADGLTRHGWVMIDGRYYDPEAQWAGWFPGVYGNSSYDITHTIQKKIRYAS